MTSSSTRPSVAFLMIVTDPDIEMADWCVASYARIRGLSFSLVVYSNWVSPANKAKFFTAWQQRYPFVRILSNDWQDSQPRPSDPRLEGPFDKCTKIWDEQLPLLDADFAVTADADFEILDGRLPSVMLDLFRSSPQCGVLSVDYSPGGLGFETYSGEHVLANERCHTWFCFYRRAVLSVPVSHLYHETYIERDQRRLRCIWDSSAFLQKAIKEAGYQLLGLPRAYRHWHIHYGAFSKNRQLAGRRLAAYRVLKVIAKRGWPPGWPTPYRTYPPYDPISLGLIFLARLALRTLFGHVDRSKYWQGWGQRTP